MERNITASPLTTLAMAIQRGRAVRVELRRHHEHHNERYIEGWPLRLEGSPRGTCLVLSASRTDAPDSAHWVLHIDRIAWVETLGPASTDAANDTPEDCPGSDPPPDEPR